MKPGIQITKLWFDDDVVELGIGVSDGASFFSNKLYVGHDVLSKSISDLNVFKEHVHAGLFNLRLGAFGYEYANGAFQARFHFPTPGKLYISCEQESEFEEFSMKTVASSARLYIRSEPALLDRFISELQSMVAGESDEAYLEPEC